MRKRDHEAAENGRRVKYGKLRMIGVNVILSAPAGRADRRLLAHALPLSLEAMMCGRPLVRDERLRSVRGRR